MTVITVGKRVVTTGQIAYIEPFDPASNPEFKPEKDFKGRLTLIDRDVVLTEQTPISFAEEHGLRFLAEDGVALSPSVCFKVEIFQPTEKFNPSKPCKTRLKWRDLGGNEQSRLLMTAPEVVLGELQGTAADQPPAAKRPPRRPSRGRNGSRRMEAFRG